MKQILKVFIAVSLLFSATACEDFLDINKSPNSPSESRLDLVLPTGISSCAYVLGGNLQVLGAMWAQHWTEAIGGPQYRYIDEYRITQDDFDGRVWSEFYSGGLNDLQWVISTAEAESNWSYYLIATSMQCFTFQMMTDLWGDIPFSEALRGNVDITMPRYDSQETIYKELVARLDFALAKDLTANTVTNPAAQDLIFGGNMDHWVAFANTLKLKLYMRLMYADPAYAQQGIATLNGAEFLSVDAVMTQFSDAVDAENPVFATEVRNFGHVNLAASASAVYRMLEVTSSSTENIWDPRAEILFSRPESGSEVHNAMVQGDYFNQDFGNGIRFLSKPVLTATDGVYFISKAESFFLQAEAQAKGWLQGNAKASYEAGIEAAFSRIGAQGAAPLYATGGQYAYPETGTFEQQQEAIITQKWMAMINCQGLEAFFELNRTHYPRLQPSIIGILNGNLPKRLVYPRSETDTNENMPELISDISRKVWWDQKPE